MEAAAASSSVLRSVFSTAATGGRGRKAWRWVLTVGGTMVRLISMERFEERRGGVDELAVQGRW